MKPAPVYSMTTSAVRLHGRREDEARGKTSAVRFSHCAGPRPVFAGPSVPNGLTGLVEGQSQIFLWSSNSQRNLSAGRRRNTCAASHACPGIRPCPPESRRSPVSTSPSYIGKSRSRDPGLIGFLYARQTALRRVRTNRKIRTGLNLRKTAITKGKTEQPRSSITNFHDALRPLPLRVKPERYRRSHRCIGPTPRPPAQDSPAV